MMKLEIAGQTITYRTAADLSRRVQERLETIRGRREIVERDWKALRSQERTLEQFLGTNAPAKPDLNKEENANG